MGNQRDLFKFVTHFWERVERHGPNECWPWRGATSQRGYGSLGWLDPATGVKSPLAAHRVAYHFTHGAPPIGHVVMHACDNPACCNPAHLRTGTVADNNRDRSEKGRSSRHLVKYRQTRQGEQHPAAQLSETQVRIIRELCAQGRMRQRDIGAQFGVSQSAIMAINTRRTWKHVT